MAKSPELLTVLRHNLRFFMELPGSHLRNANALAVKAHVAPNTVRNILEPSKRTTTASKPLGYPTLDKIELLARALNCQVWELLHPDIKRSLSEREMYRKIEADFAARITKTRA